MGSRRFGTPVVLGVAVATFAALAATSHGFPVQHLSLNDGGIWVTDNQPGEGAIGRFVKPIAQLDGQLIPDSPNPELDVWQDGPLVAAYDASAGKMYAVDAYQTAFSGSGTAVATTPGLVALGDTTIAVVGTDHTLRTTTLEAGGGSLAALGSAAKPLTRLPANAAVAVGADDTVWVAGGGRLWSYPEGGARSVISSLPSAWSASDAMQVTTVGNVPVVADVTRKTLYLPDSGRTFSPSAAGTSTAFELQQSSDASGFVVAAIGQALYSVNLGSGQPATLSSGHSGGAAAPVQVGGCVYAAWNNGDSGSYFGTCGSPREQAFTLASADPDLVFRVNNDEVVLNDTADGGVFLVDTKITNVTPKWQQQLTPGKSSSTAPIQAQNEKTPLTAKPYTQGVRPDRTTDVHVLDVDKGPARLTYQVIAVGKPDQPGVAVAIAPDGESVLATVGTLNADAHFQYTISDGRGHVASSEVTLVPRAGNQNDPPYPQPGYQQPRLSVASGGTLVVPVIGYWRDFDGDPLYVDSGSVTVPPGAGSASVTTGGAISFTAPQTAAGRTVTIKYGVTDGRVAKPTAATLTVTVVGSSSTQFVPPIAEPVSAQALAGAPLTLHPLASDLPGVDPTNPAATLALAAPAAIAGATAAGATAATDLATGAVTFTAPRPGDYFLTYQVAFGAAPVQTGTIRVHVIPATGTPLPPVTTPDVAVLHGEQPALVDVLADDYDPQGLVLGVTSAVSGSPGVQVTVVGQQWLRISADDPRPGMTATVTYTVSDGRGSATGTVAVSAVPADLSADQITTEGTSVTVRAGDSAAVSVLAGDASSIGLPVSLAGVPPAASPALPGLLASVQGADVRVVAPMVKSEQETTVSYVATDSSGATATGYLAVTIEPPPSKDHPDQAPVPEEVDTRETAGDIAVIQIPVYGVDPDGDSVTVTGVTVPPALGRVVAIGPDTISYQSYPDSVGTDTFTYQVADPYGLTGTAQVRIGILPPGPPQPPVAVDDVISAPPGVPLHWNVLASDYVAPGDTATVLPLAKTNKSVPSGVRLDGDYVYLQVPASPSDPPAEFTYGITDGSTPSLAQVIVHAVDGAKVPPIASDAVAPPPAPGAATVTVNVLKHDDDPVGSPDDLRISWVPAGVTVHGASVTIPLAAQPREVPYQVTAPDGLTATAVVYVPGTAATAIRLRPGARISLKRNGTVTVPLSQVLTDTAGRQLRITTLDQLSASPAGDISVTANQAAAFVVHAAGGYTGPGAVSVQVYDGTTLQDPHGHTATVTIPVQVGPDVPVLRCPSGVLPVVEGGAAQVYDIGQLCHVWVDTTVAQHAPGYTVAWVRAAAGISASVPGGASLQLAGASDAAPGTTGILRITPAGGTAGGELHVVVVKAPPPSASAVSVTVKAGHSVTVDLSQYVTSPLAQPDIQVVAVTQPGGQATVTKSGSTVTIVSGPDTHGTMSLVATVTDVPGRADREISVAITVTVIGHPGLPGAPSATASSRTLVVSFGPAAPNGAQVEWYTVYTNNEPHQCAASPCTITGLTNGTTYTVYVTATNSDGPSGDSARTTAEPNAVPGEVTGLATTPGDGEITLSWQPAGYTGTAPTHYRVEMSSGRGSVPLTTLGVVTRNTFHGLLNGASYQFRVQAINELSTGVQGFGPWSTWVKDSPFGKPVWTGGPTASGAEVPDPAEEAITVSWTAAEGNGRPVSDYTVHVYTAPSASGPWTEDTADLAGPNPPGDFASSSGDYEKSFNITSDDTWYEFAVTATNNPGSEQNSAMSAPIQAALAPDEPTGATVAAAPANTGPSYGSGTVQVRFTVPYPHSAKLSYVEYALDEPDFSATATAQQWTGLTPGTVATESITGLTNGTAYTVYLEACNDAGQCSAAPVDAGTATPYGAPANPTVTATQNGTSINYTWGATSDGLTATLTVCINGGCTPYGVPAAGNYNGATTVNYGYSQTGTITAYVTDTANQRAPATGTVTATATTAAPPPPAASVSVAKGNNEQVTNGTGTCVTTDQCYNFLVSVASFPVNSDVYYSCSDSGGQYWPVPSGTIDRGWNNAVIVTNGGGATSFYTQCVHAPDGETVTINITVGSTSASGSYKT